MERYFKVDYHFTLEKATEQKEKLEDAGLKARCCIVVEPSPDRELLMYWVCIKESCTFLVM